MLGMFLIYPGLKVGFPYFVCVGLKHQIAHPYHNIYQSFGHLYINERNLPLMLNNARSVS